MRGKRATELNRERVFEREFETVKDREALQRRSMHLARQFREQTPLPFSVQTRKTNGSLLWVPVLAGRRTVSRSDCEFSLCGKLEEHWKTEERDSLQENGFAMDAGYLR